MRSLLVSFACVCLSLTAPAMGFARAFTLDDYGSIVSVNDPQISPDGRQILITVGHDDMAKDRRNDELVLVDVATGAKRTLTFDRAAIGEPLWTPDSRSISFIAPYGSGDDASDQVWVMPMDGGDARVVTKAKNGVAMYAWRPDGHAIAYLMQETSPDENAIQHHEDYVHVENEPFSAQRNSVPIHLWLQDVSGGEPQRLAEGSWSIYPDALTWSPDGKYLAFDRVPDGRFNSVYYSHIAVLDLATKRVQVPDRRWSLMAQFSPDSDRLAYTAGEHGSTLLQNGLAVFTVGTAAVRDAAPYLNRDVSFFAWLPDGGFIASGDNRTSSALWRIAPNGAAHRVELGDLDFGGGTVARNGAIAFVATSSQRPAELYYLAPGSQSARRLSDYNAAIASLDLAPSREFTWHNDAFQEDGVLTYPLGYHPGVKYPLVLDIHGGPINGASTTSFSPLVQLFAAHGFIVLQPNYRGSDNLGYAYAHAIIGDNPIAGVGSDCVAGVKALEATGAVDASRIGVSGWSAGGWTTSWLITHYDMWKAAVSGAAVDDAVMQYSLSQIDALMPELVAGITPWSSPNGMQIYEQMSPITFVRNVHAATLILSDTTDPRVPTPEAYEFYTALRDLGKTVEFDAIPAYGHHPSDPVKDRLIDRLWLGWMVKYLGSP